MMISLKSNYIIVFIFFIIQILKVFGDSDFSLYAVTTNPVGTYVTVVDTFYNKFLANTSLNLNDLNIQSFLTVDSGLNLISLLCQDSNNTNYLVTADVKTGEIEKSKGIQNDGFNITNNNNYIYSNDTDDIFLPTCSNGELTILHWNFNEQSDYVNQFAVNGISDTDSSYQPKCTLSSNNGLYVFYKSSDIDNPSKLVLLDLNNTDSGSFSLSSSSSSLQPVLPTIEIYTFNGFKADNVEMIYVDNQDSNVVYVIYNSDGTTRSCTLLLNERTPICKNAYFDYPLNPYNYNYNPFFLTSDLVGFVSIQSTSPTQLLFGLWELNFEGDSATQTDNLWQSKNPSNYTYFKN
ncbi:hypothetical protein DDB_G0268142 [Dictyostelium discoideum AX4]|uniref:Uncharacterized protein n=1 Tax=Dictyostelium discoideum TaxID=44689 RepID=Q55FF1_DICDI|nr:hypothetical protein DDB_G0268142 [Dictyostelium discoideum AX4]EAL73524.1 hypothetical protein DDB_G0268142 [Dictyostelium discoideum AX4]|eukprot:XP_647582.1 hypothetical protein DDB_G0268142 [Dictyostelium discoideum AX4]